MYTENETIYTLSLNIAEAIFNVNGLLLDETLNVRKYKELSNWLRVIRERNEDITSICASNIAIERGIIHPNGGGENKAEKQDKSSNNVDVGR